MRAYAVDAATVRGVAGATGTQEERLREVARRAFGPRRLTVRDMVGPIHRRVPGTRVVRADEPTRADLDLLLAGGPVPRERAAATWRLVEALVAGLATTSTRLADVVVPPGLLAPTGLPVPPVDGLHVGWCTREDAAAVAGLRGWLADVRTPEVVLVVES